MLTETSVCLGPERRRVLLVHTPRELFLCPPSGRFSRRRAVHALRVERFVNARAASRVLYSPGLGGEESENAQSGLRGGSLKQVYLFLATPFSSQPHPTLPSLAL